MRRLTIEASSTRVPSGSWVRDAIWRALRTGPDGEGRAGSGFHGGGVETVRGLERTRRLCDGQASDPRIRHRGWSRYLTQGKEKAGTMKFETYATLQCVEDGRRAQTACVHVGDPRQ